MDLVQMLNVLLRSNQVVKVHNRDSVRDPGRAHPADLDAFCFCSRQIDPAWEEA